MQQEYHGIQTSFAIFCRSGQIQEYRCFPQTTPARSRVGGAGQTAVMPEWSIKDEEGKTVRAADFKGKVLILEFSLRNQMPERIPVPPLIAEAGPG